MFQQRVNLTRPMFTLPCDVLTQSCAQQSFFFPSENSRGFFCHHILGHAVLSHTLQLGSLLMKICTFPGVPLLTLVRAQYQSRGLPLIMGLRTQGSQQGRPITQCCDFVGIVWDSWAPTLYPAEQNHWPACLNFV